ncbi:MAG: tetratricopeptide repeat protein, partial [Bacteroidetes bacterium]|nr:tetratricopeptide repeat protein [Bacteroidota bacterium]
GGVISISGLSLVTAGFMIMRIMGIGPAATLLSSGVLEENAKLIVAEFENSTSDPGLSESVSELLRIDLSQSAAINVMDGSDILSVLSRMNREANAKIDLNTAMEIAAREGAEAVVAGEISQLGSGYVLSARLLASHDGSELLALRESAKDDGEIIAAMDRLSADLRERIGESIKTIRSADDLDRVTTSSLDALRLYSQGVAATDAGNYGRSLELLRQAVERDSTFAMAYRKLAVVYSNSGASPELQIEAAANAYRLRDRLPARERGLATAYYYADVEIDREKRVEAYENLIEQFPDETAAINNVAIDYMINWEFERAEQNGRRVLAIGNRDVYFQKLIAALSAQKKWDELEDVISEFVSTHPNHPVGTIHRFRAAMAQNQYEGADTLIRATAFSNDLVWKWLDSRFRAVYKSFRGELSNWEAEAARTIAANIERGVPAWALEGYALQARITLDLLSDPKRALQIVEDGLSAIPLESLHAFARPYSSLIVIYARLSEIEHAEQLLEEYHEVVPEGIRNGDFGRHLAEAEIMFARGQLAAGLETMRQVRTIDKCRGCFLFREGQILEQMDSLEAAVSTFTDFTEVTIPSYILRSGSDKAPAYFRLGELHSRLGNTDEAIEAYSKFVDIWINADSELQPQVAYARDRIGRLLDQSAREN